MIRKMYHLFLPLFTLSNYRALFKLTIILMRVDSDAGLECLLKRAGLRHGLQLPHAKTGESLGKKMKSV